jgi:HEAT repeat protein
MKWISFATLTTTFTALVVSSTPSFAAVPAKTALNPKVFEILNLPPENRSQAAINSSPEMYKDFVNVAFSEGQSMRLRWRALMSAAEAGREKATPDLLKASTHKQWFLRNAALVAMSEVNEVEAKKLATKLLKDKALVVRSAAVDILQKNASAPVRDLLWEEIGQKHNFRNKESLWIRAQIVEALSQKPADYEIESFSKLLKDSDMRVQYAAIEGMEKLTGVKLGDSPMPKEKLVLLWQNYVNKEKLAL